MDIELEIAVEKLSRTKLEEILTDHGFEIWQDNTSSELRKALKDNLLDGTISQFDVLN